MHWYQKSAEQTLQELGVTTGGYDSEKAEQLLEKHGKNVLAEGKKKSVFMVFLSQFADLLVLILIAAAIISMFSGNIESTIVIFAVIIMNAILGTIQYFKAERSLESLKKLSSPEAKVIRDGVIACKAQVAKGVPLSKPIRDMDIFPNMLPSMMHIGEETGNIEEFRSVLSSACAETVKS